MADQHTPESPMSPHKKAYRGPQPDAATFATQQEFLDSLTPIPLECVDENNRKCSYCWRSYGESNPGQDDAEAPVRFRCNHVFGEQCMRSLFAMREPIRVDLVPLSFAPGSRGADLGSRLSTYVDLRGVEKSALLTGGSREKDFVRLLQEAMPPKRPFTSSHTRGLQLLGKEWYGLYFEMFIHSDSQTGKIHLLENAIIFDSDNMVQDDLTMIGSYGYESLVYGINPDEAHHLHASFQPPSAFPTIPVTPPYATSQAYDSNTVSSTADTLFTTGTSLNPFAPTTWDQEAQKLKEEQEQKLTKSGSWQDVLSNQSKLDSLVAKHKELQAKEAQLKKQIEAEKKALKASGMDPQFVQSPEPNTLAQQTAKKAHKVTQPQQSNAQSLAQQQLAKQKKAEEKRTKVFIDRLARSFVEVYEAYERYQYDEAVAAGRPPPVKKLRLADQKTDNSRPPAPSTPMNAPDNSEISRPRTIQLVAVVHEKSSDAKGIEVAQPYSYDYMETGGTDDEEEEEEDGIVDAERAATAFAGKTIFLKRKACKGCCNKSLPLVSFLTIPEYAFWRDNKQIPDDCPKCRRVLFKKNG